MTSNDTATTTEAREGQDHTAHGPTTLTPDLGVAAAADHKASLHLFDLRGTDQIVALVLCACGWRRQSQHPRAAVDATDPQQGPWVEAWDEHVGRAVGLDVPDDRGIDCSRIVFGRYPGQQEILAAWQWAVSREGTPITANARDAVAMDLAFQFAAERDAARTDALAAIEHARGQLGITRTELDALRADAEELRGALAAAQDDYRMAATQWHDVSASLAEAREALENEREHRDCATVADLERAKDDLRAALTARDSVQEEAKNLRIQRTVILACASVIGVALVMALVVTGGYGS